MIAPRFAGLIDQATPEAPMFEVVAVKGCVCEEYSVAQPGEIIIEASGINVMVAEADCVGSAALVAVSVTICCDVSEAGAV